MEVFVWLFVGLMLFVAWLFFITYRVEERSRSARYQQMERQRELARRHDRAFWARAERDVARLRELTARADEPPARPGPRSG